MSDRVSNARKKELEQPDPFLESMYRTLETTKKIKKQLAIVGIIVTSIIAIVSITFYTINSAESKASIILADAMKIYSEHQDMPIKGYEATKGQFETLLNDYPNTSAGEIGRLKFADICYAAEQYDVAYKNYTSALDDFKNDPIIKNIILSSLGYTSEALNRQEEAQKHFKAIADGSTKFMKDDALFNLGMVAIANGDNKSGVEMLKTLSSEYGSSVYKIMADDIIARN
ncbi:MAG: hypothetical protein HQK71_04960 [Desulfamplus sp.]|nr:hypothetical protein [Desulfamplus sp.]